MSDFEKNKILQEKIQSFNGVKLKPEYSYRSSSYNVKYIPKMPLGGDGCDSHVPCYDQFRDFYHDGYCAIGCVPNAMGMILGYYDRMGIIPNIFAGQAPSSSSKYSPSEEVRRVLNILRGKIGTRCSGKDGASSLGAIRGAMNYLNDIGYYNYGSSEFEFGWRYNIFDLIKREIDSDRPIVVGLLGSTQGEHAVVAYGYIDTGDIGTSSIVVNFGWGKDFSDRILLVDVPMQFSGKLNGYLLGKAISMPIYK